MRIRILLLTLFLYSATVLHGQQKPQAGNGPFAKQGKQTLTGKAKQQEKQQKQQKADQNEIYIDAKGIIRLQQNNQEASFFGVNYTLPFAYGYRSHKALKINIEQAIDQDVYHLARLGINAFRVHVWDTEISDSVGNLKHNEHLRLFDYLVSKLEERQIRIIITPIAYWGNGYPDQDEKTGSFSEKYGKEGAVVKEDAFKAQERYLSQFFRHVNPFTGKTYGQDKFVIATEINNEPHHSGPKSLTTSYVNRMKAAIKGTGWTKPVFYNISESPAYADAVAKSDADGFSFQWYPTGLVSGHELKGNLLPNVDRYVIPFDTIPEFKHKPRMIYEFDAADVLKSYLYPAMARSFKTAGFQWATQFAYDPMGTAYANTEYQTHYLNLAYTPGKAISLLIAGKVFRQVPLYKSYGSFPADTAFGPFTVSYKRQLSEMNAPAEFYYSNHTRAVPVKISSLAHIAGVGSSTVVSYTGKGAYFIDRLADGNWRLEVMPDAVSVHDPFAKNCLDSPVTQIVSRLNEMKISLPDLGTDFTVSPLNDHNLYKTTADQGIFSIRPGAYLVLRKGVVNATSSTSRMGMIGIHEFVDPSVLYNNNERISWLQQPGSAGKNPDTVSMSGKLAGQSGIKFQQARLEIYNADADRDQVVIYSPEWKTDPYAYLKKQDGNTLLQLQHKPVTNGVLGGLEVFVKDKIKLAYTAGSTAGSTDQFKHTEPFNNLILTAGASVKTPVKIVLFTADGAAFSAVTAIGTAFAELQIPFSSFTKDTAVLLPRPYPGFQALTFSASGATKLQFKEVEKIQMLIKGDAAKEFSVEIGNIRLENK